MKLYDNDEYFDEFKCGVYALLADDPTWDRANQIIDLFLSAPEVEAAPTDDPTIGHANLDRSQWPGCDICTKKYCFTCHFNSFSIGKPCIDCHEGSFYKEADRNFCQNCGRPLNEEAWAEMERRVDGRDG